MTQPNDPAFPVSPADYSAKHGLTKREYFAIMAMQSLLARVPKRVGGETDLGILESKRIVGESCIMADSLIAELNSTEDAK